MKPPSRSGHKFIGSCHDSHRARSGGVSVGVFFQILSADTPFDLHATIFFYCCNKGPRPTDRSCPDRGATGSGVHHWIITAEVRFHAKPSPEDDLQVSQFVGQFGSGDLVTDETTALLVPNRSAPYALTGGSTEVRTSKNAVFRIIPSATVRAIPAAAGGKGPRRLVGSNHCRRHGQQS